MKKITPILLIFTLILGMTACNNSKEFSKGTNDGTTYTSNFSGIKLKAPDSNWIFYNDEQLNEVVEKSLNLDLLTDEQKKQAQQTKDKTIYDAILTHTISGSNITIVYEDLSKTPGASKYSANDYTKIQKQQLVQMQGATIGDIYERTVAGEKYVALDGKISINGVTMEQLYLIRKIEDYMLTLTVTKGPISENSIDDLLNIISKK